MSLQTKFLRLDQNPAHLHSRNNTIGANRTTRVVNRTQVRASADFKGSKDNAIYQHDSSMQRQMGEVAEIFDFNDSIASVVTSKQGGVGNGPPQTDRLETLSSHLDSARFKTHANGFGQLSSDAVNLKTNFRQTQGSMFSSKFQDSTRHVHEISQDYAKVNPRLHAPSKFVINPAVA